MKHFFLFYLVENVVFPIFFYFKKGFCLFPQVARAVLDEQIEEEELVLQVDRDKEDGGGGGGGGGEEKGDGEDGVADVDDEEGEIDEGSWIPFRQKH